MGTSNLTWKHIRNAEDFAISDDLLQRDCPIAFDDFDVLVSDSTRFNLSIKESLSNVTSRNMDSEIFKETWIS